MIYIKQITLSLAAAFFIVACGGGGGGSVSKATITADNAKSLAVAGTEAVKSASDSDSIPLFKSGSSNRFDVQSFSKQLVQQAYATENLFICDSGTAVVNVSDSSTESNFSGSMVFSNCVINAGLDSVTIDGTMTFRGNTSSVTINANLTVIENGRSEAISFSGSCAYSGGVLNENSCRYSASFIGIDGRNYSASNLKVSGDEFSGYSISGSVTDPDFGAVTLSTTTPVLFNCANGNPGSGVIVVTGNGSATVTFNSCDSFTVTFNGVPTQYNWADI